MRIRCASRLATWRIAQSAVSWNAVVAQLVHNCGALFDLAVREAKAAAARKPGKALREHEAVFAFTLCSFVHLFVGRSAQDARPREGSSDLGPPLAWRANIKPPQQAGGRLS